MTFFLQKAIASIAPSPLRGEGWGEGFRASNHHSATTGTAPLSGQLSEGQHP